MAGLSSGSWEELTAQGEGATGKAETEDQGGGRPVGGGRSGPPAPVGWATINAGTKMGPARLAFVPRAPAPGPWREAAETPSTEAVACRERRAEVGGAGRQGRVLQKGQTLQGLSGSRASPGLAQGLPVILFSSLHTLISA